MANDEGTGPAWRALAFRARARRLPTELDLRQGSVPFRLSFASGAPKVLVERRTKVLAASLVRCRVTRNETNHHTRAVLECRDGAYLPSHVVLLGVINIAHWSVDGGCRPTHYLRKSASVAVIDDMRTLLPYLDPAELHHVPRQGPRRLLGPLRRIRDRSSPGAQLELRHPSCSGRVTPRRIESRREGTSALARTLSVELVRAGAGAPVLPGQGGEAHRRLQAAFLDLGRIKGYEVHSDRAYDHASVRRKPDVTWHREGVEIPLLAIEIELGSRRAITKSWETLEKLHHHTNCLAIMLVPEDHLELAGALVPRSLAQLLGHVVLLHSAEQMLNRLAEAGLFGLARSTGVIRLR